ncbi:MAG TPA: hypothetical protein VIK53_05230 [Verrucomicrobiae bacterium]
MALISCKNCGANTTDKAPTCRRCGNPLSASPVKSAATGGSKFLSIITGAGLIESMMFGNPSPEIICPHCQTRGNVRTKPVRRKKGVSGGKATAALLTGGISLLATGLSRKEHVTEAFCLNCKSRWDF